MEVIHDAPLLSSFTPLSEHQSQTPTSFYTGKPVLYHHCPNAKLLISERELHSSPALSKLSLEAPNGTSAGEDGAEQAREVAIEELAIWVTSEYAYQRKRFVPQLILLKELPALLPIKEYWRLNSIPFNLPPRNPNAPIPQRLHNHNSRPLPPNINLRRFRRPRPRRYPLHDTHTLAISRKPSHRNHNHNLIRNLHRCRARILNRNPNPGTLLLSLRLRKSTSRPYVRR